MSMVWQVDRRHGGNVSRTKLCRDVYLNRHVRPSGPAATWVPGSKAPCYRSLSDGVDSDRHGVLDGHGLERPGSH